MVVRALGKSWLVCLAVVGGSGCSKAPSIEIVGTFFPAWMFCITAALVLTGLIRMGLARRGVEQKLGPLVVFYPGLVVALSCLLWFIFFS
jgi:hypothetical protein